MATPLMHILHDSVNIAQPYIDFTQPTLYISMAAIAFCPTMWNIVCRNEYRNKTLTRLFGNKIYACYFLGALIFGVGAVRDVLYHEALVNQPRAALLPKAYDLNYWIPIVVFGTAQALAVLSIWVLGLTGTFMGDYFGILSPGNHRVEKFPYSVLENPMYVGSTFSFLGVALWDSCPAGFLITLWVHIVYTVALRLEKPFTESIYDAGREKEKEKEM